MSALHVDYVITRECVEVELLIVLYTYTHTREKGYVFCNPNTNRIEYCKRKHRIPDRIVWDEDKTRGGAM